MEYKLVITQSFEDDLDEALDYISHKLQNPAAANRLLGNAEKIVARIEENPMLYPLYHDEKLAEKGYHYAVCSHYLIFYTINEKTKTISAARFLYGSQNITDIL
ncbi:MAG: type II toxin-antitoxin system RelE/ParE family toxin [Oscillospiraceae bacterium]